MIPYILLQTVIVPLIAALACALLGKKLQKNVGWIAAAALIYVTALLAYVGVSIWNGPAVTEVYQWPSFWAS
jgi:NADH:ubiquinone oxidoreductase subunit 5 (subunit L)/multisubunit Na+/H+ antiporter MnhA subunit